MLATIAPRTDRWLVDIVDATDAALCGGKAVGLAKLKRIGLSVPRAICLTTDFYRHWLDVSGFGRRLDELVASAAAADVRRKVLEQIRCEVEATPLSEDAEAALREGVGRLTLERDGDGDVLSVRSSGVDEDHLDASHAGVHASRIVRGHDMRAVIAAIKTCWASLWTETAWTYRERLGIPHASAAMAVVVQRYVAAVCSGVAFSADPLTNDRTTVVIEAGWGSAAALGSGRLTPDEYRVSLNGNAPAAARRRPGRQTEMTVWRDGRSVDLPLDDAQRGRPVLNDTQVRDLAGIAKTVERTLGTPVDIEWVCDADGVWAVQARPITTLTEAPHASTLWTRANLKEVFPELPSPLALSYLTLTLNRMFRTYHAAHGYSVAPDSSLVSVIHGRPYLNLSLMQQMTVERGGDPAIVGRLFGGASPTEPRSPAPASHHAIPTSGRVRLAREMVTTFLGTPYRGRQLFRAMRRQAAALADISLEALDDRALSAHASEFFATLMDETTLGRLHEVVSAQSRAYMTLEALLTAWMPTDADGLLKRLMTGLGTLPNVRMTYRLMDLAALAVQDARARAYFTGDLDEDALRGYETALGGAAVLAGLRAFLREFGHRGPYESDVMSARFADDPGPVLRLIQLHVRAGATQDAARHAAERCHVRRGAMADVRGALHQGYGHLAFMTQWALFRIMCSALHRLLALRDECRHVTTMMVAHLRRVALEIGRRASRDRVLADATDVFFLTFDEMPRVLVERDGAWRLLAADRRRQRARDAQLEAPDVVSDDGTAGDAERAANAPGDDELVGYGVSSGIATGRVRVLRSAEGIGHLSGEIVVIPAIEPTLTPIFPLVRGFIAEMGGLLSHAAILAREYGLPAVVSVRDATRRLRDGDRVELDGSTGRIRVLERAAELAAGWGQCDRSADRSSVIPPGSVCRYR